MSDSCFGFKVEPPWHRNRHNDQGESVNSCFAKRHGFNIMGTPGQSGYAPENMVQYHLMPLSNCHITKNGLAITVNFTVCCAFLLVETSIDFGELKQVDALYCKGQMKLPKSKTSDYGASSSCAGSDKRTNVRSSVVSLSTCRRTVNVSWVKFQSPHSAISSRPSIRIATRCVSGSIAP